MLLTADDSVRERAPAVAMPPAGRLRDISRPGCPTNLPFSPDAAGAREEGDDGDDGPSSAKLERRGSEHGRPRASSRAGRGAEGEERVAEAGDEGGEKKSEKVSPDSALAHGAAFVGRHLEIHQLLHSCLHNQLTAVSGDRGSGKSALVLEAARHVGGHCLTLRLGEVG